MSQVHSIRVSGRGGIHRSIVFGAALLVAVFSAPAAHAQSAIPAVAERLPQPTLLKLPRPVASDAPATAAGDLPNHLRVPDMSPAKANPHPSSTTQTVGPISFLAAPFASDGAPDVYGSYGAYLALSGDFAHVNHLDTVVFQGDGTMNYMSNDGKGNFTKKYVVVNPSFIDVNDGVVADLNGDGYLDIVAACSSPVGFLVFMNNRDGTFAPAKFTALPTQAGPGTRMVGTYLNIADINHDGKLDITASAYRYGASGSTRAGTLYNMYFGGNGDGTFQAPIVGSTAYVGSYMGLRGVTIADMDNDGKPDLVAAIWVQNSATGVYSVYLSVALGDGAGNFAKYGNPTATNTVYGSNYAEATMQAIDLNHDGKMDILWTSAFTYVYTSFGNGDGTLQDPNISVTAVNNVGSFTTGDFDKDGYTDISVFIDGFVSVFQGLGNGAFSSNPVSQYANELAGRQPLIAQDFDGDGTPDLLIASAFRNQLSFLKGYGDGTFRAAPLVIPQNPSNTQPNNTASAADINVGAAGDWFGDGKINLLSEEISGGSDYLDYARQNGKGGFNFTRLFNLSQYSNITGIEPVSGDFNNDGRDDFILTLTSGIGIGLSNGDGTITRNSVTFPFSLACTLGYAAVGDINNDGNQDIVVVYGGDGSCASGNTRSGFFTLLGNGKGSFTATYTAFGDNLYLPRLADLNHDGKLDLVLDDISATTPAIYVIAGDGSGILKPANARTLVSRGGTQNSFLLDDFNGDGIPDLTVLQSGISGATDNRQKGIFTMVGNGDFTFQPQQFIYRGSTGTFGAYADFNQDNHPDLVVNLGLGGIVFGGMAVYPNLGNGSFAAPVMLQSPGVSSGEVNNLVLTGDFNGDGAPDILLGVGNGYVPNVLFPNAAGNQLTLVAGSVTSTQFTPLSLSVAAATVGGQLPTGTVSFYSNGASLGSASLVSGISTISTAALGLGTDTIVAKYNGDGLNYPSTSNSVIVTVTALAPSFVLSGSTSQLVATGSSPAQLTLALAANQTFQGSAAFACQGLPASLACTFSPVPVTLAANGTASLQAVITYNSKLAVLRDPSHPGHLEAAEAALAGMLVLLVPTRRRKALRFILPLLLLGFAMLAGPVGCSSSNTTSSPFTANFNIVATGVSGTTSVVRSVPLSISVQP